MGNGIGVAREGQRGAIAPPKIPQKYVFNKKKLRQMFIFLPRSLLGRLTVAIQGVRSVPPQEECPLKDKFLDTPMVNGEVDRHRIIMC